MGPDEYLEQLRKALAEYRFSDVSKLNARVAPTDFQPNQVKTALGLLRRKRLFAELERMAGLFALGGHTAPVVRRQWAQALLDQNRVAPALAGLQSMNTAVAQDPVERSEVQGLIGRAYKQLFVNESDADSLVRAIAAYAPHWRSRQGDYRWHGINLAALLSRARRDGIDPHTDDDPVQIARAIRDEIEDAHTGQVWDYGTALEASIVLGDAPGALEWTAKYVKHPDADAFELGSTLRQFKEIWQLEGSPLGKKVIPVLEFALLNREGGSVEPSAAKVTDTAGFEAVWGSDSSVQVEWLDTMYQRCMAVARVYDTNTGQAQGTGFVIPGGSLNTAWGDRPVFVTNSHVVSTRPADEAPLRPADAGAEFTRLPGRPKVTLGALLFSHPRIDLDVSVLGIEPPTAATSLTPSDYLPALAPDGSQPQRIYVVGHPRGGELTVTLYDNSLVGYDGPYVHYRSPTEGGNSGSPVFTRQWKLIALHHRAREERQVNEGVCFEPIRRVASAAPPGQPA